jgi:murein DD-endopeptidase MepM/ murein hydrolase activator NlpD
LLLTPEGLGLDIFTCQRYHSTANENQKMKRKDFEFPGKDVALSNEIEDSLPQDLIHLAKFFLKEALMTKKVLSQIFVLFFSVVLFSGISSGEDARLMEFVADGFKPPVTNDHYGYGYADVWDAKIPNTLHTGLDFNTSNDCGAAVKASANGIIETVTTAASWGRVVLIKHRFYEGGIFKEYTTQYAHIAPLDSIHQGDYVYTGQKIGYIAWNNNGCNSFEGVTDPHQYDVTWGPHLHSEVRNNVTLSATNWPILATTGDVSTRTARVNAAGYVDPNIAATSLKNNTEENSSALNRMLNLKIMQQETGTTDEDRRKNNKHYVITKKQAVETIANTIHYKLKGTIATDPIGYAIEQGLISKASSQDIYFDKQVKRDIVYILAVRAYQIIKDKTVQDIVGCTSSSFTDVQACNKYLEFLYENNIFMGYKDPSTNGLQSFSTAYATRNFVAKICSNLLPVNISPIINLLLLNEDAKLGTGDLQVTLEWDTGNTDVDIHVFEPDGTHVSFGDRAGTTATLDVDDTNGYGPENIFVAPGDASPGTYQIYVVYYGGSVPTTATIKITAFANTHKEVVKTYTKYMSNADSSTMINVANVEFPNGTISE